MTVAAAQLRPTALRQKTPTVLTRSKSVSESSFFLPYQLARIKDASQFILDEKARRIGGTFQYAYKFVIRRAKSEGKSWWTANNEGTVLEYMDYCGYFARMLNTQFESLDEELVVDEQKILAKSIRFKYGGKILGLSGNAGAVRGKGGDVGLDEFSERTDAPKAWAAAEAAVKWGDILVVLSTHTSVESVFNRLVLKSKKLHDEAAKRDILPGTKAFTALAHSLQTLPWSHHRTDIHAAVADGLVEKINERSAFKKTREEFLAECRAACLTEEQWQREYLCIPSSDATALLPYSLLWPCTHDACATRPDTWQEVYQGVDFARRGHDTAIITADLVGDVLWLREHKVLNNIPWQEQLGVIGLTFEHPKFRRGAYDQTGLGDMPVETLQRERGEYRVEGVVFSAAVKHDLAARLWAAFKDRRIRIPNDPRLLASLNSVRCTITASGQPRYEVDPSAPDHADLFWALALANYAASSRSGPFHYAPVRQRAWAGNVRGRGLAV